MQMKADTWLKNQQPILNIGLNRIFFLCYDMLGCREIIYNEMNLPRNTFPNDPSPIFLIILKVLRSNTPGSICTSIFV